MNNKKYILFYKTKNRKTEFGFGRICFTLFISKLDEQAVGKS